MQQADGLELGKYGTVLSSGPLEDGHSWRDPSGSIEIWAQPTRWMSSATVLALYRPEQGVLVTLRQSLTDLELVSETSDNSNRPIRRHFYVADAFAPALQRKKPVFIAVTVGPRGTIVYLDGRLARGVPGLWIPAQAFSGRVILGDSARQPDSFRGQIRGLAIYSSELNGEQVFEHYRNWTHSGSPEVQPDPQCLALYLFTERTGRVAHNQARAKGDLLIPERYMVIDKIALEPFWKEFNFSESYWSGNLKNIIGFIPLGFCFFAYFGASPSHTHALRWTFVVGLLVSVAIEVFQAYLPSRDSGTTDIFTNVLGTYLGVLCYQHVYREIIHRFPQVGWFA
ncbi:MAG TPA: VanZ family protein [Blastocatellia bacterium]|nr:VanZ family protein [Blastocatellia bacterium]